jgi:hypothetical protein
MTNNTEIDKQEPNPYNAHKPWHDEIENKQVESALVAYVPPKRERKKKEDPKPEPTTVSEEPSEGNHVKRYYDLKNYHDKTVTGLRSELDAVKKLVEDLKGVSKAEPDKAPDSTTAPEAPPVVATKDKEPQSEPVIDEKELRAKKAEAKLAILEAHSDFNKIVNDAAFHEWAESQTAEVKEWIYDNPFDAESAIEALNRYKAFVKESQKPKQSSEPKAGADSMISARTTDVQTSDGKKVWTAEDIKNMSVSDWEKHREEILESYRKGR